MWVEAFQDLILRIPTAAAAATTAPEPEQTRSQVQGSTRHPFTWLYGSGS
jgi:hypothetical protein